MKQVLRRRQIRPHWMFVLDSLLSRAVRAALAVLAPGGRKGGAYLPACAWGEGVILGAWRTPIGQVGAWSVRPSLDSAPRRGMWPKDTSQANAAWPVPSPASSANVGVLNGHSRPA